MLYNKSENCVLIPWYLYSDISTVPLYIDFVIENEWPTCFISTTVQAWAGLSRMEIMKLCNCDWEREHRHLIKVQTYWTVSSRLGSCRKTIMSLLFMFQILKSQREIRIKQMWNEDKAKKKSHSCLKLRYSPPAATSLFVLNIVSFYQKKKRIIFD